jgi:hypothetical protein
MIIVQLFEGLGNQMFQYACGKSLAYRIKTGLVIDNRRLIRYPLHVPPKRPFNQFSREYSLNVFSANITTLENMPIQEFSKTFNVVEEHFDQQLRYDPDFAKGGGRNIFLTGYWQSWKYFKDIDFLIRKNFQFTKQGFSENVLQLSEILQQNKFSIALHVRRTDYMQHHNSFIGILPVAYYSDAIQYISNLIAKPVFYIFSDDPDWAETNIKPLCNDNETHIIRNNSNVEDLYLMTQCKHNIIANSTFSWWGAWLNTNPDRIVVTPKIWFIGMKLKVDEIDLIPSDWISL